MTKRIDLLSERTLSEGWTRLTEARFRIERSDGAVQEISREVFRRHDAVVVLPYDPDRGKVLLARQFRAPVYLNGDGESFLEACAGGIEPGESAEDAVQRELEEELGYTVTDLTLLWSMYPSPGSVSERLICFIGRYSPEMRHSEGGGCVDEGEDIAIVEMDFADAMAAIEDRTIADAKTIMLLQHLALNIAAFRPDG